MSISETLPDYLPARMLNEFVYCPRLYYYEWVEGVFAHNRETVEGELRHQKLDQGKGELAAAGDLASAGETIHSRSVQLASEEHRLIAKMDLIEADGDLVTPVDYKRGSPKEDGKSGELVAWDPDRVQLAVQAMVLRENGYRCDEGIIYYVMTKQRVRVSIDDKLIAETLEYLRGARSAAAGEIPLPLIDSPKCPRCSLVGICLPDETLAAAELAPEPTVRQGLLFDVDTKGKGRAHNHSNRSDEIRRLVPARDDLRPLYLNTQGLHVGKSGNVLKIKEKDKVVQEVRVNEICQLNVFGNIQLSTQAIQTLCENEVPIAYFSMGGWFYGITQGLGVKNIFLRREQFRLADVPSFCLRLARTLTAGKIRNQRTMLLRNHVEPPPHALAILKFMCEEAEEAESQEQLLGIEGNAARIYFEHFAGMIKQGSDQIASLGEAAEPAKNGHQNGEPQPAAKREEFPFDFVNRNRRPPRDAVNALLSPAVLRLFGSGFGSPPRDAVNALLSLAYSMLAKDLTIITQAVGFDPYMGFYHQPRFGRASLALDLMEPFRPLIADSAVLSAINTRMVSPGDFVRAGQSVALKPEGRKAFFRAYEQRMDSLVTHPMFGYRANYRRILEIQSRLLARVLTGELGSYPVFVTR